MRAKPRPLSRTSTTPSSFAARPSSGKSSRPELERVAALRLGRGQRGVELGVVLRLETQRPRLGVGHVGGPPLGRRLQLVQFPRRHASRSSSCRRRPVRVRPARAARAARRWARRLDTSPARPPPWRCTRAPPAAAACRRPAGRRPSTGASQRTWSKSMTLRSAFIPSATTPRSCRPTARALFIVSRSTTRPTGMRPCAPVAGPVRQEVGREAGVGDEARRARPPSPRPNSVSGCASISPQASRLPSA